MSPNDVENPHIFKYASQYGLRAHFVSAVRMVSASPVLRMRVCVSQVHLSAEMVPGEWRLFPIHALYWPHFLAVGMFIHGSESYAP